ncbi:MAG: GIY-YIG nuclease family protein [Lentimicrobium sp.]|nr:GIY-YIG nuclease family protein [Lentimicrobium sp.]
MFLVYVIKSVNFDFTYVGLTANLERRIYQHNNRQGRSTKPYAPFTLIYSESFADRLLARKREKYLKSTAGKIHLSKLLSDSSNNLR